MTDLRALDAEIARLRGWVLTRDDLWRAESETARREDYAMGDGPRGLPDPPPFSSSWALAGPLLEEFGGMLRARGGDASGPWFCELPPGWSGSVDAPAVRFLAPTPCEAIARAWLAAQRSKA